MSEKLLTDVHKLDIVRTFFYTFFVVVSIFLKIGSNFINKTLFTASSLQDSVLTISVKTVIILMTYHIVYLRQRNKNKKKIYVNIGQAETSVCLRQIESIWNVVIELELRNDAMP